MHLKKSRFTRYNLIVIPILLILGFLWLYPFFWILGASLKTQREMFLSGADFIPHKIVLDNYVRAWTKAKFNQYFFNTVLYAVTATVMELLKSSMAGYALARYRFFGRDFLYKLILATLFIPIASIIIPQFVLIQKLGLLDTRLGVMLVLSGGSGALYILLFTGFFETIPSDLFDSAKMDGANFWQTFKLVLPLTRPVIATVIIFQFMHTWNEFNIPLIFTLGKPSLRNLAVGMYAFQGEHSFDWTGFAAGTVISIIPVLLVFLMFQGYFVRGLAGAVKE